jgi:CHAT domain-containing protein
LVVLSACESALVGGDSPDEIISLPAGLLQAGVPGVVGSLWSVPASSTAELMVRFYEHHYQHGLAGPEALRRAQQQVRDSTLGEKRAYLRGRLQGAAAPQLGLAPDQARPHARPHAWAAFAYYGV